MSHSMFMVGVVFEFWTLLAWSGSVFAALMLTQPYIYTFRMGISLPLLVALTCSREHGLSVYL